MLFLQPHAALAFLVLPAAHAAVPTAPAVRATPDCLLRLQLKQLMLLLLRVKPLLLCNKLIEDLPLEQFSQLYYAFAMQSAVQKAYNLSSQANSIAPVAQALLSLLHLQSSWCFLLLSFVFVLPFVSLQLVLFMHLLQVLQLLLLL